MAVRSLLYRRSAAQTAGLRRETPVRSSGRLTPPPAEMGLRSHQGWYRRRGLRRGALGRLRLAASYFDRRLLARGLSCDLLGYPVEEQSASTSFRSTSFDRSVNFLLCPDRVACAATAVDDHADRGIKRRRDADLCAHAVCRSLVRPDYSRAREYACRRNEFPAFPLPSPSVHLPRPGARGRH